MSSMERKQDSKRSTRISTRLSDFEALVTAINQSVNPEASE